MSITKHASNKAQQHTENMRNTKNRGKQDTPGNNQELINKKNYKIWHRTGNNIKSPHKTRGPRQES